MPLRPLQQKLPDLKKWKRWVEVDRHWPKPKYGFSKLLRKVGDYVETFPMTMEDRIRFKDAAKFWAYHHDKRVSIKSIPDYDGKTPMWRMRVTLLSLHRQEEYPDL